MCNSGATTGSYPKLEVSVATLCNEKDGTHCAMDGESLVHVNNDEVIVSGLGAWELG